MRVQLFVFLFGAAVLQSMAATINWQGYTWNVKSGAGLGPGPNTWNGSNVAIDANGLLHLKISKVQTKWTCAEVSTVALGYGTYQFQVIGSIDAFDPYVVLGLFPYAGPDGTNEIDMEFSRWGKTKASAPNGIWTVYPNDAQGVIGSSPFSFALSEGNYTTARMTWTPSSVTYWLMGGHQPVGTTTNVINTWTYAPANPQHSIPQTAMPLHINLWLFQGRAPLNGRPVEVVISSFTKV